eukprot:366538-Chlamydomonas_euryale.AAC.11
MAGWLPMHAWQAPFPCMYGRMASHARMAGILPMYVWQESFSDMWQETFSYMHGRMASYARMAGWLPMHAWQHGFPCMHGIKPFHACMAGWLPMHAWHECFPRMHVGMASNAYVAGWLPMHACQESFPYMHESFPCMHGRMTYHACMAATANGTATARKARRAVRVHAWGRSLPHAWPCVEQRAAFHNLRTSWVAVERHQPHEWVAAWRHRPQHCVKAQCHRPHHTTPIAGSSVSASPPQHTNSWQLSVIIPTTTHQ